MAGTIWQSPDGNIRKQIVSSGASELKPTEDCHCSIKISSCSSLEIEKYSSIRSVIIGDTGSKFERLLHNCLMTMSTGEVATVTFRCRAEKEDSFTLKLVSAESNGQIYEWSAERKYNLAMKHRARGIDLYSKARYVDASHRFGKGLKILCSIPIEVDESPNEIDGVKIEEILGLKAVLYNNLASCYLKHCDYETVLKLCQKVLERDEDNIKALYKQAIARCETQDYEGSQEVFLQILRVDPENKAVVEKLKFVNGKVAEGNARVNAMIKKMFN